MTEREIPDSLGFLFGGMTDHNLAFAPPALSEPEIATASPSAAHDVAAQTRAATPVYGSRREARAAGAYGAAVTATPAAATPVTATPVGPTAAVPTPRAVEPEATQAMDVSALFGVAASALPTPPVPMPSPAHAPVSFTLPAAPAAPPTGRAARQRRAEPAPQGAARASRRAPRSTPAERKTLRQRLTGTGVMLLVGGLFAVLALPAYADNDATSLTSAMSMRSQKLNVDAAAATTTTATVARDSYTATSAADLKKLYSNALRQQNIALYMQSGAKAQGDDYPWFAELSRNQGGGLSPLNYYYRECVDFVAWRLNRDAGSTSAPFKWTWSTLTPNGGNASQWKSAWLQHGWPTGTTPQVGAVAWFPYNHVAYVSGILNDGSVAVEEYNTQGDHLYDTRIIQPGDAYYLYAPPA